MRTVNFGIIGCGLMGREFASAAARWCHLPDMTVRPEIVAVCDSNGAMTDWFERSLASVAQVTADYKALLANPAVEAVYIAVPHNLHQELYIAALDAGKHLMGEKPFGIDKKANDAINAAIARRPGLFVRCSSEFPFFPAMQRIGRMFDDDAFGRIIEIHSGFIHSSDLDPQKPINWKRMLKYNGEYGCLGDLGMHPCHTPFRAGFVPTSVRAVLSNIFTRRPDGKGNYVPCETWDNAALLCTAKDNTGHTFPLTIKTQRIAPGEKDTWYFEVMGTRTSARFSTKDANSIEIMEFTGREQAWQKIDMGHETAFKSITGRIFEFGFSDAILHMWAAFLYELDNGKPLCPFAACVTPAEVAMSHTLFTAALKSHASNSTMAL
jgi:predicted dehydrogenase